MLKNAGDKSARYKPPRAGIGRVKGVPNAITRSVREVVQALVEDNAPKAQMHLDRVGKKNSAKWLSLYAKLMEFILPKLQRTELKLPAELPLNGAPIATAEQASSVYAAIMGDVTADLSAIVYEPPPGSVVAEQPAREPQSAEPSATPSNVVELHARGK